MKKQSVMTIKLTSGRAKKIELKLKTMIDLKLKPR